MFKTFNLKIDSFFKRKVLLNDGILSVTTFRAGKGRQKRIFRCFLKIESEHAMFLVLPSVAIQQKEIPFFIKMTFDLLLVTFRVGLLGCCRCKSVIYSRDLGQWVGGRLPRRTF